MRTILDIITSRWFLSLIGAIIFCVLIWLFGPLIGFGESRPLTSEFSRLVAILIVTFIWGASNLFAQARARRRNNEMVQALAKPVAGPADGEIERLGKKFQEALTTLRSRRFGKGRGRSWLYELPWYLMIGPPGSGKTTALIQSGLRFPLADHQQDYEYRGVGGTRDCDWFFTDEAVLIDTAGRFTTQDSDKQADHATWLGFLDLLKKYRRRQPVNGVIVALSCTDLLQAEDATIDSHAREIRARLSELEQRLDIQLPVYLLLTKADLIAGFNEFFADLGEHEREQVWGTTLPLDTSTGHSEPFRIDADLDGLVQRLAERQLERLQSERDYERRAAIFNFPAEFASIKPQVARLIDKIAYRSDYQGSVNLRGLYFSSGTQEGTPIDRLMQSIAGGFGIAAPPPFSQRGNRSYFLTNLLRDVIFGEAGLVRYDPKLRRRERLWRTSGWTAASLAIIGAIGVWGWSYLNNQDRLVNTAGEFVAYAEGVQPFAKRALSSEDRDLAVIAPHLDRLAAVKESYDEDADDPLSHGFGLSQKSTLETASSIAYDEALESVFLPRLLLRLEAQMRANINEPEFVLAALRVYLMLGGDAQALPEEIKDFFVLADWELDYEGEPELIASLSGHIDALLPILPRIEKPALDRQLIVDARRSIKQIPLAKRAYDGFLNSEEVTLLPEWSPLDHAGPQANLVLTRRSQLPLNRGIPGVFTYEGFHRMVLPNLETIAAEQAFDSWVIGTSDNEVRDELILAELQRDILRLYYDDYIEQWERLIRDVTLRQLGDLNQSVQALNVIAGPSSPLKLMLEAALKETRLTVPPPEPELEEEEEGGVPKSAVRLGTRLAAKAGAKLGGSKVGSGIRKAARLAKKNAGSDPSAAEEGPQEVFGQPVEDHFQSLALLVEGADGAPGQLDQALVALGSLRAELHNISLSPNPDQALLERGGLATVAQPVAQSAANLPEPLAGMVGGIAEKFQAQGQSAIKRRLNAIWQTEVLPFCQQATSGRFPFVQGSQTDISLDDFGRLLGPGGMIDTYTNTHLAPLVDMARPGWSWQRDVGLSDASLRPFEVARRIRNSLFAGGGTPRTSFTVKPVSLDASSGRAILQLDGQSADYAHGPVQPTSMQWPGPNGINTAGVTFIPVSRAANQTSLTKEGAWAWFRLLKTGRFQRTSRPDLFNVAIGTGPHWLEFEILANSVANPFDLDLLSRFRCPNGI